MTETPRNTVGEFSSALEQLMGTFAQLANELKRIDWVRLAETFNQRVADHLEAARQLAEKGWTMPAWCGISDPLDLCKMNETALDDWFTTEYTKNDYRILRQQVDNLIQHSEMSKWGAILIEVRDTLIDDRYLISVPALLAVLEGYAVAHVLEVPHNQMRRTDVSRMFNQAGLHNKSGIEALPAISSLFFLGRLFASSPFDQERPQRINRHWALHGRDQCNWLPADAFRLLNALETLCWIKEIQEDRRPAGSYSTFDVEAEGPDVAGN